MITTNVTLDFSGVLFLGRRGEHNAREFVFDISPWVADFGSDAEVRLLILRPRESTPYLAEITREGTMITWVPDEADFDKPGDGKLELQYVADSFGVKSAMFRTHCEGCIGDSGNQIPQAFPGWFTQVLDSVKKAEASAEKAEELAGRVPNISNLVHVVDYGEAEYDDLKTAWEDGKVLVCRRADFLMPMYKATDTYVSFRTLNSEKYTTAFCIKGKKGTVWETDTQGWTPAAHTHNSGDIKYDKGSIALNADQFGQESLAAGFHTIAGDRAVALGDHTEASWRSMAFGGYNRALGTHSFAGGAFSQTAPKTEDGDGGTQAFAMGDYTIELCYVVDENGNEVKGEDGKSIPVRLAAPTRITETKFTLAHEGHGLTVGDIISLKDEGKNPAVLADFRYIIEVEGKTITVNHRFDDINFAKPDGYTEFSANTRLRKATPCVASANAAVAMGMAAQSNEKAAFSLGLGTVASAQGQHVVGKYNKDDPDMALIVGGGSGKDDRKNLFTVDWKGNVRFLGDVCIPGDNTDEARLLPGYRGQLKKKSQNGGVADDMNNYMTEGSYFAGSTSAGEVENSPYPGKSIAFFFEVRRFGKYGNDDDTVGLVQIAYQRNCGNPQPKYRIHHGSLNNQDGTRAENQWSDWFSFGSGSGGGSGSGSLTEEDKADIVNEVIAALPTYDGTITVE